jgi:hypothetical protein
MPSGQIVKTNQILILSNPVLKRLNKESLLSSV